jgi:hypothetical protein
MHFYALRISCESCSRPFVVGGSPQSDLTSWHGVLVECSHCGASILATTGEVVDLGRRAPDAPGSGSPGCGPVRAARTRSVTGM